MKLHVIIEDCDTEKRWQWPYVDTFIPQIGDCIYLPYHHINAAGKKQEGVSSSTVVDRYIAKRPDYIEVLLGTRFDWPTDDGFVPDAFHSQFNGEEEQMPENKAIWLGGMSNGCFMSDEEQQLLPAISALGQKYNDFQNSQYRGEWDQKTSLTFGEVRDLLVEVVKLMKR